ncbi:MAG: undecaprenyldiphospho-muramoylpentapeptide beta-N-acetylglucosaminyltransferase [Candidatus Marinimicrobia bacterium]|nr:undecaprenyldiphospho-muramoylpentapeptide beta-N-acetylglucosaminyltransferase [Candidatus Neomarinimicrobiota bacterium]
MPEPGPNKLRVLIAGGGTGGHLYPAIAIADGLRKRQPGSDIRFIGSQWGLEATVLPRRNEIFYPLNITGLQRGFSGDAIKRNLNFSWRFLIAYRRCRQILRSFKPQVVVGTGGYASGIPLLAAQRKKLATLLQEQNSYPGFTTRRLAKKASLVCLTYEEAAPYLETDRWVLTGNPVRFATDPPSQADSRRRLGLPLDQPVVFVLGGSQGSTPLNNHFMGNWRRYTEDMGLSLLWQTGRKDFERLQGEVDSGVPVVLLPFIEDMAAAYMAADLVICRAGAMTLSELTALGRPAVLVPLPTAAADHQTLNARVLRRKKAARLVPQVKLAAGVLEETVRDLFSDPNKLVEMAKRSLAQARPEASETISNHILELAGR